MLRRLNALPRIASRAAVVGCLSVASIGAVGCQAPPSPPVTVPAAPPPSIGEGSLTSPTSWARDDIFQDVVRRVVALRGLALRRPLAVTALDDAAFEAAYVAQTKRYLGETDREVDPRQTLGFYDFQTRRVFVRSELPAWSREHENPRGILAHEVVHALQHQHFPALLEPDLTRSTDSQQAVSALLEGDAEITRAVFEAMEEKRPPKRAVAARFLAPASDDDDPIGENPDIAAMSASAREVMLFPYRKGAAFVAEFFVTGGFPLVNRLYESPPTTSAAVLHPGLFLYGQRGVPIKPIPVPTTYEAKGRPGSMGELGMRLVLRELSVPRKEALELSRAWRGDFFMDLGRTLFRGPTFAWVVVFDSDKSADRALRLFGTGLTAQRRGRTVAIVSGLSRRDAGSLVTEALDLPEKAPPAAVPPFGGLSFARVPPALEATGAIRGERRGNQWVIPGLGVSFAIPPGMACETGEVAGLVAVCGGDGETFLLAFSTASGSAESQSGFRVGMAQGFKKSERQTKGADEPVQTPFGAGTSVSVRYPDSDTSAQFVTAPICAGGALVASFHAAAGKPRETGRAAKLLADLSPIGVNDSAVCKRVRDDATTDLP